MLSSVPIANVSFPDLGVWPNLMQCTALHWHVWTSMGAKIFPGNQIGITEATCGNPATQTDLCPTNDV